MRLTLVVIVLIWSCVVAWAQPSPRGFGGQRPEIVVQDATGPGWPVAFLPGTDLVATGLGAVGNLALWDTRTGHMLASWPAAPPVTRDDDVNYLFHLEASRDGRTLMTVTNHDVALWDVPTRTLARRWKRENPLRNVTRAPGLAATLDASGRRVALRGADGRGRILARDGSADVLLPSSWGSIEGLRFSHDGRRLRSSRAAVCCCGT